MKLHKRLAPLLIATMVAGQVPVMANVDGLTLSSTLDNYITEDGNEVYQKNDNLDMQSKVFTVNKENLYLSGDVITTNFAYAQNVLGTDDYSYKATLVNGSYLNMRVSIIDNKTETIKVEAILTATSSITVKEVYVSGDNFLVYYSTQSTNNDVYFALIDGKTGEELRKTLVPHVFVAGEPYMTSDGGVVLDYFYYENSVEKSKIYKINKDASLGWSYTFAQGTRAYNGIMEVDGTLRVVSEGAGDYTFYFDLKTGAVKKKITGDRVRIKQRWVNNGLLRFTDEDDGVVYEAFDLSGKLLNRVKIYKTDSLYAKLRRAIFIYTPRINGNVNDWIYISASDVVFRYKADFSEFEMSEYGGAYKNPTIISNFDGTYFFVTNNVRANFNYTGKFTMKSSIGSYYEFDEGTLTVHPNAEGKVSFDPLIIGNFNKVKKFVIAPTVTELKAYQYTKYFTSLEDIEILGSNVTITSYSFLESPNVKRVVLGGTNNTYPTGMFKNCKLLSDVELRTGLTGITTDMFYGCTELKSIDIPETVTSIQTGAFRDTSLETVINRCKGVQTIGAYAFLSNAEDKKAYGYTTNTNFKKQIVSANYEWFEMPDAEDTIKPEITKHDLVYDNELKNVVVTLNAVDNISTSDDLMYRLEENGEWQTSPEFTFEENGKYTFYVKDKANNISEPYEVSVSEIPLKDNENPVITGVDKVYNDVKNTVTLNVNATDNIGVTEYSFDGGLSWQTSNTKEFDANQTVKVCVKDEKGNKSDVSTVEITEIKVVKALETVEIADESVLKKEYKVGEEYAPIGQLKLTYSDKSVEYVDIDADMVTKFNTATAGSWVVELTHEGHKVSYAITVKEDKKVATSIEIVDELVLKKEYKVGEGFSPTGQIKVNYNDGSHEIVPISYTMVSKFNTDSEGASIVELAYEGCMVSYAITVVAEEVKPDETPVAISVELNKTSNKVIKAKIHVDGEFSYIELPNGQKVYKNDFVYSIRGNDTYVFNVVGKDGVSKDSAIVDIDDFDNEAPLIAFSKATTSSALKVTVIDDNYSHTITPNGERVEEDTFEYDINKGLGTFIAFDKKGNKSSKDYLVEKQVVIGEGGKSTTFVHVAGNPLEWTNKDVELVVIALNEEDGVNSVTIGEGQYAVSMLDGEISLHASSDTVVSTNGEVGYTIVTPYGSYTDVIVVDKIDKDAPVLNLSVDGNKVTYTATDALSGVAKVYLPNGSEISLGGVESTTNSFTVNADGEFTLVVEDLAGNVTTQTFTVTYDPTYDDSDNEDTTIPDDDQNGGDVGDNTGEDDKNDGSTTEPDTGNGDNNGNLGDGSDNDQDTDNGNTGNGSDSDQDNGNGDTDNDLDGDQDNGNGGEGSDNDQDNENGDTGSGNDQNNGNDDNDNVVGNDQNGGSDSDQDNGNDGETGTGDDSNNDQDGGHDNGTGDNGSTGDSGNDNGTGNGGNVDQDGGNNNNNNNGSTGGNNSSGNCQTTANTSESKKEESKATLGEILKNLPFTLNTGVVDVSKYTNQKINAIKIDIKEGVQTINIELNGVKVATTVEGIKSEGKKAEYDDLTVKHWAFKDIAKATELGLLKGVSEKLYSPKASLTFADTLTGLNRVLLSKDVNNMSVERETVEKTMKDHDIKHWAYYNVSNILAQLNKEFITTLVKEHENLYTTDITRDELAYIIYGVTKDLNIPATLQVVAYKDIADVPEHISYVTRIGAMVGDKTGKFNRTNKLTRAELATVLTRLNTILEK